MYAFIGEYANIKVPSVNKFTLQKGENLYIDGEKYSSDLKDGLNKILKGNMAETTVFVRKDWFYYLDSARKSAEVCQQKPGTHCESWYGYFSRVLYASLIKDKAYTESLCEEFNTFFECLTETQDGKIIPAKTIK
mgnify:CR=1 FL=1